MYSIFTKFTRRYGSGLFSYFLQLTAQKIKKKKCGDFYANSQKRFEGKKEMSQVREMKNTYYMS